MTGGAIRVAAYVDVLGHGDIGGQDALAIVDALNDCQSEGSGDAVCWLPSWLADEKPLHPVENNKCVFVCQIERETEKAWRCTQDGRQTDWIPKSVGELFERASGATLTTPQNRLDEFTEGDA